MTRDGMCGVFIPDRVLAGWWGSQWKASDREWVGRCITGCGRGQVYKHLYTSPSPQPVMHLPAQYRSLAFHWLFHEPARTLSGINTPHIPSLVILHPPAHEDGTDRGFRNVGY